MFDSTEDELEAIKDEIAIDFGLPKDIIFGEVPTGPSSEIDYNSCRSAFDLISSVEESILRG